MKSVNISDARTESAKRWRVVLHTINVTVVSFVITTLLYPVSNYFGIDPILPGKDQDPQRMLLLLSTMFVLLILLYWITLHFLSWLFAKLKV